MGKADQLSVEAVPNVRFVTAASLFDGHDAAINIMRRILQACGVEVIHLGHNRSVAEVVNAALQEDAHGIALSSYQGGHVEYLKYMVDMLREKGGEKIRVFAGGGGVIIPEEKAVLEEYGVTRIYTPEDGQVLGLNGMIENTIALSRFDTAVDAPQDLDSLGKGNWRGLAHVLSALENRTASRRLIAQISRYAEQTTTKIPVLGITGTGGAGKSSLTDELILRFRRGLGDQLKIAIIAVDPTRRRTGGALLGDRIRMNAINHPGIFMRSVATRGSATEIPDYVPGMISACKIAGFDLVMVETPGIGQGNAGISSLVDCALYVMTSEFGAQSQLEKIDMLDFADVVAINKFDRQGAADAHRDVCKQVQRNRAAFSTPPEQMPVFGTIASRFNDDGMTALYQEILSQLVQHGLAGHENRLPAVSARFSGDQNRIIPEKRIRYLAEIAETVRDYKNNAGNQSVHAREIQHLTSACAMLVESGHSDNLALQRLIAAKQARLDPNLAAELAKWDQLKEDFSRDEYAATVGDKEIRTALKWQTLSGTRISKVALPDYQDHGDRLKWFDAG